MKSAPIITTDAHGQKLNGKRNILYFSDEFQKQRGCTLISNSPGNEEKNYVDKYFAMVWPSWVEGRTFFVWWSNSNKAGRLAPMVLWPNSLFS